MLVEHSIQKNKQQGAALIAVLIIIVVVTMLGITAMRMGLTGLTIATNSQIGNLLFQAADDGLVKMESAIRNGGASDANIATAMGINGILGAKGSDVAYCITPIADAMVGAVAGLTAGACNTSVSANYLSARNISMVQVNYRRRTQNDADSNSGMDTLTSMGTGSNPNPADRLTLTSTAIMPSLGTASETLINNCLNSGVSDDVDDPAVVTITDCLTDAGAVFTTHQDEYEIGFSF